MMTTTIIKIQMLQPATQKIFEENIRQMLV